MLTANLPKILKFTHHLVNGSRSCSPSIQGSIKQENNKPLADSTAWVNPKRVMLNERSPAQNAACHFLYGSVHMTPWKKQSTGQKPHQEVPVLVTRGGRGLPTNGRHTRILRGNENVLYHNSDGDYRVLCPVTTLRTAKGKFYHMRIIPQ